MKGVTLNVVKGLGYYSPIISDQFSWYNNVRSGRGAVRLARLHGVQEVGGSNPLAPTLLFQHPLYFKQTFH